MPEGLMTERPIWPLADMPDSSGDDAIETVTELPTILGHNLRRLRTRQCIGRLLPVWPMLL